MPKGNDVGTMNCVKSEVDDVANGVQFTTQRNVFLKASSGEDTEQTLKENNWSYAKYENEFYILGEDAIKLKNLLTVKTSQDNQNMIATKVGDLRRPMKDGVLNTGEEKLAIAMIQTILKNLVGKPSKPGEVLCFCAPAETADTNLSPLFHKTILTNFFKSLGYTVECITEALAIIFAEKPTATDPETNEEEAFTGVAISCGAGQANVCLAKRKLPLISFSVAKCGDWIDKESSKVAGIDVSAMTMYKEKKLDLDNIDHSDMRQSALDIFYQSMIEYVLTIFADKFNQLDNKIDMPLEIILAGGTASAKGFLNKFNNILSTISLPFKIKNVRLASDPLNTVSLGCLLKAMSIENKKV